jgi:hypothetical protein
MLATGARAERERQNAEAERQRRHEQATINANIGAASSTRIANVAGCTPIVTFVC